MKFSELLEQYLEAREKLQYESNKTPPSITEVQIATRWLEYCAEALDEEVQRRPTH